MDTNITTFVITKIMFIPCQTSMSSFTIFLVTVTIKLVMFNMIVRVAHHSNLCDRKMGSEVSGWLN